MQRSDLDVCRDILNIIDDVYQSNVKTEVPSENVSEAMMDAYGQEEDGVQHGQVTFSQEKGTDKGSVKIEAAADDMQELAKVLQLAGITLPQAKQEELLLPKKDEDEPCDACADDHDHEDGYSHSTDKQQIINVIKQRLKDKLSG